MYMKIGIYYFVVPNVYFTDIRIQIHEIKKMTETDVLDKKFDDWLVNEFSVNVCKIRITNERP